MVEKWFFSDPLTQTAFFLVSIGLYYVLTKEDFDKIKKPKNLNAFYLCLAINMASFFVVGLFCLINISFYMVLVYLIEKKRDFSK
jgi:hypothetical protein